MTKIQNSKRYDLEDRTFQFAKSVRFFIGRLKKTISSIEDCKQLVKEATELMKIFGAILTKV